MQNPGYSRENPLVSDRAQIFGFLVLFLGKLHTQQSTPKPLRARDFPKKHLGSKLWLGTAQDGYTTRPFPTFLQIGLDLYVYTSCTHTDHSKSLLYRFAMNLIDWRNRGPAAMGREKWTSHLRQRIEPPVRVNDRVLKTNCLSPELDCAIQLSSWLCRGDGLGHGVKAFGHPAGSRVFQRAWVAGVFFFFSCLGFFFFLREDAGAGRLCYPYTRVSLTVHVYV